MGYLTLGQMLSKCQDKCGIRSMRQAEYAARSIPSRGRVGTLRVWSDADVPAFVAEFKRIDCRRIGR